MARSQGHGAPDGARAGSRAPPSLAVRRGAARSIVAGTDAGGNRTAALTPREARPAGRARRSFPQGCWDRARCCIWLRNTAPRAARSAFERQTAYSLTNPLRLTAIYRETCRASRGSRRCAPAGVRAGIARAAAFGCAPQRRAQRSRPLRAKQRAVRAPQGALDGGCFTVFFVLQEVLAAKLFFCFSLFFVKKYPFIVRTCQSTLIAFQV